MLNGTGNSGRLTRLGSTFFLAVMVALMAQPLAMGSERTINLYGEDMSYDDFTRDPSGTIKEAQARSHQRRTSDQDGLTQDVHTEVCIGLGVAGTGARICVSDDGTVSVGAGVKGIQGSIYGNLAERNAGVCAGVGGSVVEVGPVGVGGSTSVCADVKRGAVSKTSVQAGAGQVTVDTYREE